MNLLSNEFLSYLIGADEVNLKDGKIIIKFLQNSERYICMKEAVSFLEEFNSCNCVEKNFLIDEMKNLYDYFNRVLENAKKNLPFGFEYIYDEETQQVIDKLKKALISKGKI